MRPAIGKYRRDAITAKTTGHLPSWQVGRKPAQRRAMREFGRDPNQADVRAPDIVEDYEQWLFCCLPWIHWLVC